MAAPAPTAEQLAALRALTVDYSRADNDCLRLNREIANCRTERSSIENQIAAIMTEPAFAGVKKLDHEGSTFIITRPGWTAPVSLTKGTVYSILRRYFEHTPQNQLNIDDMIAFFDAESSRRAVKMTTKIDRKIN
jgi:hypothetical protein